MPVASNSQLNEAIASFVDDPLGFVCFVFPWGQGELAHQSGPDTWQTAVLEYLGTHCLTAPEALQVAVASGHGVGKTALVAWLLLWFLSTRAHPQAVVTANTKTQLDTKTWRELAKWHQRSVHRDWFAWTATRFYHVDHPATWFASAIPWSATNAEAFAGTHETDVLLLFDEASAIDDLIWETAEGALTTPGALWLAFGNPTRNTGRFKECFPGGRLAHRWHALQVDSRRAKLANQAQIAHWITDYGEDSDFVRVRVKGVFPRASSTQFISQALIDTARARAAQLWSMDWAPRIIGVDVARFGDDESVILIRQGHRILEQVTLREKRTTELVGFVAKAITTYQPSAVFIDEVGIGAGVVDQLQALGHAVLGVNAGESASEPTKYRNLRAEMWDKMRQWLTDTGILPDDPELCAQLTGLEYGYTVSEQLQLERKEDMKARGLASPDRGDALALTFARPVTMQARTERRAGQQARLEYDILQYDRPRVGAGRDWSP